MKIRGKGIIIVIFDWSKEKKRKNENKSKLEALSFIEMRRDIASIPDSYSDPDPDYYKHNSQISINSQFPRM